MTFNDYNEVAYRAINEHDDTKDEILNWVIGLSEEVGEVANIVKHAYWGGERLNRGKLIYEMGDVLWYLNALCNATGTSLERVAELNVDKLLTRHPDDSFSYENSRRRHENE